MTIPAAGILITTPAKEALFLLRGDGGDWPLRWCIPGGKIEDGESALDAAKRETVEEIGSLPKGAVAELCRSQAISSGVAPDGETGLPGQANAGEVIDFTTYTMRVPEKFDVVTSGEHVGFAWAPIDQPPQPLHPGVQIALDRLGMTELDAARAIADGRLTSPLLFTDHLALFAMRISGTGLAYRIGKDEYAWRSPEEYLGPEMQARWLGAPVVWEHPAGDTLTSKDFSKTSIGAVMLTFVKGDELWCVARVNDAAAIKIMGEGGMSTSPGVVLKADASTTVQLEDGSNLLVEGVPFLCDHLAVCSLGVWDKGGPATGIAAEARKDSVMADNEAELKARKDAEEKEIADKARKDADEALSKIADAVGALAKRFDAYDEEKKADKARKDAEEAEAEEAAAKKDAEEKEAEEAAKADKAKKDAEEAEAKEKAEKDAQAATLSADVLARLAAVEKIVPKALTDAERSQFAEIQARFDAVQAHFGKQAPRPLDGETPLGYRRRLLRDLQPYSRDLKDVNLAAIHDDVGFGALETIIFKDAIEASRMPADLEDGELRAIIKKGVGGREITEFVGKSTFVKRFAAPTVYRATGRFGARS